MIRSVLSGPSSVFLWAVGTIVRSVAASPRRRTASAKSAGDCNSRGTDSGETEVFWRALRTIRGGARKKQTKSP